MRDTGGIDGGVVTTIANGADGEPTELWSSHHVPDLCANPLENPEIFADPVHAVLVAQAARVVKDLR